MQRERVFKKTRSFFAESFRGGEEFFAIFVRGYKTCKN